MRTSVYFSDKTIMLCAVCCILSFICQIFKVTQVVNGIYIFSLLLIFVCYFLSGSISQIMLTLIALIGIAAIAQGRPESNADYYTHILIVICSFICIEVGADTDMSIETYKKISYMFLMAAIVLEVAYYFGPLKTSYFKSTDWICLNFPNPNAAGLWVCCIFIVLIYAFFLLNGIGKGLFLIVALGLLPIIVATQSRNSYLACLVLIAGAVFTKVFKIKKVPDWVLACIVCLPMIVFFFYMLIIVKNMGFWENLFDLENSNKGIGSREAVWKVVLDDFWNCFLFGDYKGYYDEQMHNSLMTIFCRFGAAATTVCCMLQYRALKKIQDNTDFYSVLSLAAVLFTGCFEASVFIGIAGLYIMLLLIPAGAAAEYNHNLSSVSVHSE